MQIKLVQGDEEKRVGLPDKFLKFVSKIHSISSNLIKEREWVYQGKRYGDEKDVISELLEEISAAYSDERLELIVSQVEQEAQGIKVKKPTLSLDEVVKMMRHEDWKVRYAALSQINPSPETIEILDQALQDPNVSIRRLATAYLGMIDSEESLELLKKAMKDSVGVVRRTAGDAISDLGNPKAIPIMIEALQDKNKLVRWRAARYLYEVGDHTALEPLKKAQNDPEFEVKLQISMAIERIQSGDEASGTVWQQITNTLRDDQV